MNSKSALYPTPPGLRHSRGPAGIHRLVLSEPEATGPAIYQLYVLEVDDPNDVTPINYYVGSTNQTLARRRKDHAGGGLYAATIFKKPDVSPGPFREDLTAGLPRFRCRACAENAEGRLARVIAAQLGAAHSDQLNNRMKGKVASCEGRTSAD